MPKFLLCRENLKIWYNLLKNLKIFFHEKPLLNYFSVSRVRHFYNTTRRDHGAILQIRIQDLNIATATVRNIFLSFD